MRVVGVAGRRRRLGGIPPIVTVLITISAVVAASLVAWFMFVSTRTATQTPIVEVTNAVYIGSSTSWRISFTIRNISGASGATVNLGGTVQLFCDGFGNWAPVTLSCSPGTTLAPGQSASCSISGVAQPISPSSDGRLGCQLQLSDGTVVGFTATRP